MWAGTNRIACQQNALISHNKCSERFCCSKFCWFIELRLIFCDWIACDPNITIKHFHNYPLNSISFALSYSPHNKHKIFLGPICLPFKYLIDIVTRSCRCHCLHYSQPWIQKRLQCLIIIQFAQCGNLFFMCLRFHATQKNSPYTARNYNLFFFVGDAKEIICIFIMRHASDSIR